MKLVRLPGGTYVNPDRVMTVCCTPTGNAEIRMTEGVTVWVAPDVLDAAGNPYESPDDLLAAVAAAVNFE